jgi:hypothetical protein
MAIKWSDIHICCSDFTGAIYIGKLKPMKNRPEISEWVDKSGDMADECMYAVCCKLKGEQEGKEDGKPYAGYKYEDGSQLVWVAPNHKIIVE